MFLITKDSRLNWFQYRITQSVLPTNRFLFDIKQVISIIVASAMSQSKLI